jgi:AcrR family transcriptional regulator
MPTMQEKMLAVRRRHVLEAAIQVFAQKGFRGATIRDIALAAGVSDGTIYNLFDNKAALLHAILEGAGTSTLATGDDAPNSLPSMMRARWDAISPESLGMLRVVLSEALIDPDFRSLYRQTLLAPAIDQLVTPFSVHTDDADTAGFDARLVTALFMGLIMLRLLGDDVTEQGSDALLDRLATFVERGLAPGATKSAST